MVYARNVCPDCQSRSRQLEEAYQQHLQAEMQQFYHSAVSFYRQWLRDAPVYPLLLQKTEGITETLELEQAAQMFAQIALHARYPKEVKTDPPFYWMMRGWADSLSAAPKEYKEIIAVRTYTSGLEIELVGSIYRLPPDQIVIRWE